MNTPGYEALCKAAEELSGKIKEAIREALETAYTIGQHDAAQRIGRLLLGLDRKDESDVEEFIRKLWEENDE